MDLTENIAHNGNWKKEFRQATRSSWDQVFNGWEPKLTDESNDLTEHICIGLKKE